MRKIALLALCLMISLGSLAQKLDKAATLDAMIQKGIEDWKIPGWGVVVVHEGETVFHKNYGVADLETKAAVNSETLFNMGSTTKAVVAMALGILVDQRKLAWDDPVRKHLPEFELSDGYITQEARVQDLLTHNLGISEADLLWVLDSVSTEATIKRFALAEKDYPIRGGFQYNNLMYAVAGEVIHKVSGQHWADFVAEHIFKPLEMERSVGRVTEIFGAGNYATPYLDHVELGMVPMDHDTSDQIGAAGMIWSCTDDIVNYLKMLVGGGKFKDKQILETQTFNKLFEPQTLIPANQFYPTQQLTEPHWMSYGLGWFQQDYRGEKLDFHTGSISGLMAIAGVMHDKGTAVYVFGNLDHAELRHAILFKALDLWAFEDDSRDWHKEVFDLYYNKGQRLFYEKTVQANRKKDAPASLPLEGFTGEYHHPMYGKVLVSQADGGLHLLFNDRVLLKTEHWHYNTFRSNYDNTFRQKILLNFQLDEQGKASTISALGVDFEKSE